MKWVSDDTYTFTESPRLPPPSPEPPLEDPVPDHRRDWDWNVGCSALPWPGIPGTGTTVSTGELTRPDDDPADPQIRRLLAMDRVLDLEWIDATAPRPQPSPSPPPPSPPPQRQQKSTIEEEVPETPPQPVPQPLPLPPPQQPGRRLAVVLRPRTGGPCREPAPVVPPAPPPAVDVAAPVVPMTLAPDASEAERDAALGALIDSLTDLIVGISRGARVNFEAAAARSTLEQLDPAILLMQMPVASARLSTYNHTLANTVKRMGLKRWPTMQLQRAYTMAARVHHLTVCGAAAWVRPIVRDAIVLGHTKSHAAVNDPRWDPSTQPGAQPAGPKLRAVGAHALGKATPEPESACEALRRSLRECLRKSLSEPLRESVRRKRPTRCR